MLSCFTFELISCVYTDRLLLSLCTRNLLGMDARFVFMLILIELGKLAFAILEVQSPMKFHEVYNAYDQDPSFENGTYKCFDVVKHCTFQHERSVVLAATILHFIVIISSIVIYSFLMHLILKKNYGTKFERLRGGTLLLNGFSMIISFFHFMAIDEMIRECSKYTQQLQIENLVAYLILNIMEITYILFDTPKTVPTTTDD